MKPTPPDGASWEDRIDSKKATEARSLSVLAIRALGFLLLLCVALFAALVQAQTTTTLVPSSYVTTSGTSGGQPVASSIDILDELGTTNRWSKYVEFQTTASANYAGYRVFNLPTSISPSSVTAIQARVNYQGPDAATQAWTWQLYNWSTASYTTIGTNAGAPSWGAWTILKFNASGILANYVRASDGQIRVQILSNNNADNCDIDYEALVVTNNTQTVSLSVSPASMSVQVGGAQPFTATLQNDTQNKGVTWALSGAGCSGATCGALSNVTTKSVTYTAPAVVPTPAAVTLTATSIADAARKFGAAITVTAAAGIVVSIAPTNPSVQTGIGTQPFTATLQNDTQNKGVTWALSGAGCSGATCGSLSNVTTTSVTYTAPTNQPAPNTVKLTATSIANTTKSYSTTITLTPPVSVSISPPSASVTISTLQPFTATLQNDTQQSKGVIWALSGAGCSGATCGSLSNVTTKSVTYTAPAVVPIPAAVTLTATSVADTNDSAQAVITITASNSGTGANYYVSPSGSDSNPGTITSPWRTIQHAANSVQAGDTVYVLAGTYHESVNFSVSGTSSAPITFIGQNTIVDGTGLVPSGVQGLFNIASQSYITVEGFEIRNYTTSSANATPAGIWISGSGSGIQILNNNVHNITTSSEKNGNAFGIAVYGTAAPASLDGVTISGNTVYNLRTGQSESVNVDGNVTNFVITHNIIHDNDNIGIDAIGFEEVSPDPAYDYARNGLIAENTIYNISGINNPGEGNQYDADGIYVDGGSQIIIERNNVSTSDLGIEVASEHQGHVSSYVIVRNNLVFRNNSVGISIGGYASNVGGTDHCTIVNNSLLQNDTKNTGSGELQVQYYATNNVFENNNVYATSQGLFINNYTKSEPSPVTANGNLYFSPSSESSANFVWNGTNYTGFTSYQTGAGEDGHSLYADPQYLSLTTPNLQVQPSSPAVNAGANQGTAIEGPVDFAGSPRVQGTNIDIGAYEQ